MKQQTSAKIILIILGGILTILLTVLALMPFLNELLVVEVVEQDVPGITAAPLPEQPEEVPVTVYYVMEDNSKKISALYIEVFHIKNKTVSYMEIPVDTKVNLSEELYKSLQTYGPELPQYLKLSNMAESFSTEYGLTGCNRILSEVLGISLTEYVRTAAEDFSGWLELQAEKKTTSVFFEAYSEWLRNTISNRTMEERWTYYESRRQTTTVVMEMAPGSREKDGYLISSKRSKERLEEMMWGTEAAVEQEQ